MGKKLIMSVALLYFSTAALAMDAEDLLFMEFPNVVTVSKKTEKMSEAPATIYVVTKKQIKERNYSNLKDILRDAPGMETLEYYWSEQGTLVPVRGVAGNNKIVVLINGTRVNPPGGEAMMFRSDMSVRNAEQVEIVYGPGSTLYGQDAISAVINIISQSPVEGARQEIGFSVGNNCAKELWVSAKKQVCGNRIAAHLQYYESALTDIRQQYPQYYADYERTAAPLGKGTDYKRWDIGTGFFFRFENDANSLQLIQRLSSRSSSEDFPPNFARINEAKWSDQSTIVEVRNSGKCLERLQLETILTFNRYEIMPDTKYVWQNTSSSWEMQDDKYGVGFSGVLEERVDILVNDNVSVMTGLSAGNYDIVPKATIPGGAERSQDLTNQGGTFEYYTGLTAGGAIDTATKVTVSRVSDVKYQVFGAFIEGKVQLTEGLKTILGFRADKDTRNPAKTPLSPRIAGVYEFNTNLVAKYIFTQAFVSPAPYYAYNVFRNTTQQSIANPSLEPETATSHEVNVVYSKGKAMLGCSLFQNKQENLIVSGDNQIPGVNIVSNAVYVDPADPSKQVLLVRAGNSGKSMATGIDLTSKFKVAESVSAWCSYSYVWFETESGTGVVSPMVNLSRHNLRLGSTYDMSKKLSCTASLLAKSKAENPGPGMTDAEKELWKDPFELDLAAVYKVTNEIECFANFTNLTNSKYIMTALQSDAYPVEGMTVSVGARYLFD